MREGEGQDILLLHGYLSKKESFYYQIKFLSRFYRVTAPDFPAFGASAPITSAWSVGDYCDWLDKFIKAAGLNKPVIIAHSFGARVAIKYLSSRPCAAEKLIITGGAGIVKPRSKKYLRRVKAYRIVKKFFPKLAEKKFGSKEYRTLPPVMRESYKKIVNEDLKDCAKEIRCKTLLLYGADDTVTPADEEGKIFNSLIPCSELKILQGGHFCFSENPAPFNDAVYKFLNGD
ncbi:MAG: alpha/beta hydrolase [Clostridia bacterium]|nr:alpha/beta hydrolase [Clostridia bacterium]